MLLINVKSIKESSGMDCGETVDNYKENEENPYEIDVIEDDEGFLPDEKIKLIILFIVFKYRFLS